MVQEMARETCIAKERDKFSHGLIRWQPDHLMGIEDGYETVVTPLSAGADLTGSVGLLRNPVSSSACSKGLLAKRRRFMLRFAFLSCRVNGIADQYQTKEWTCFSVEYREDNAKPQHHAEAGREFHRIRLLSGGHGAVPRAVAGGVWTPDICRCRHRPEAPFGTSVSFVRQPIDSTPLRKPQRRFWRSRDVPGGGGCIEPQAVAEFQVRARPWVADVVFEP